MGWCGVLAPSEEGRPGWRAGRRNLAVGRAVLPAAGSAHFIHNLGRPSPAPATARPAAHTFHTATNSPPLQYTSFPFISKYSYIFIFIFTLVQKDEDHHLGYADEPRLMKKFLFCKGGLKLTLCVAVVEWDKK